MQVNLHNITNNNLSGACIYIVITLLLILCHEKYISCKYILLCYIQFPKNHISFIFIKSLRSIASSSGVRWARCSWIWLSRWARRRSCPSRTCRWSFCFKCIYLITCPCKRCHVIWWAILSVRPSSSWMCWTGQNGLFWKVWGNYN